jgi:ABC-2 type transport system permease protein
MIWNVLQIHFRRLMHNRIELALMFVVPIAFFSVFAMIFGNGIGGSSTPKIKVAVVDEVNSESSRAIVASVVENQSLRRMRSEPAEKITRDQATQWVRSGSMTMAIVVTEKEKSLGVDLLSDASDQVASQVVSAIVSRSLAQSQATMRPPNDRLAALPSTDGSPATSLLAVPETAELVRIIDVMGSGKSNPVISMYAAGIAVMFLLFGATGAGGTLLEERENQTLDRLLSTQMTMDQLLLGKWFYITIVGILQVTVMFIFGAIVFGVDLLGHLDGFLMMTIVTSAAAAAFGLFLATLCKTRGQLNGLSVILVLTMSALGGSMVPRYIMSDGLREAGMWTFNAWALDGYDKVFWRDLPVESLGPQLTVLMISGVGFLFTARLLALRWESQ